MTNQYEAYVLQPIKTGDGTWAHRVQVLSGAFPIEALSVKQAAAESETLLVSGDWPSGSAVAIFNKGAFDTAAPKIAGYVAFRFVDSTMWRFADD